MAARPMVSMGGAHRLGGSTTRSWNASAPGHYCPKRGRRVGKGLLDVNNVVKRMLLGSESVGGGPDQFIARRQ